MRKGLVQLLFGASVFLSSVTCSFAATDADTLVMPLIWLIAPLGAVLALVFALIFYKGMMKSSEGNDRMREIAGYVREGAMAYLFRQYKVVSFVFIILFAILVVLSFMNIQDPLVPFTFLAGGILSGLCGYIGMRTATNASARTAQGVTEGLNKGLQISFRSGAVMGLVVVGFGLLFVCACFWILDRLIYSAENMANGLSLFGIMIVPENCSAIDKLSHMTASMVSFGMGASTQALFARVGGGIYTKAADVGADLVGKVEAGIPEDDPRNPATIADNVGDNVGDVAGMGADLYESYCGSILAAAALGGAAGVHMISAGTAALADAAKLIVAPMVVAGIGIMVSILGIFLVRCRDGASQKDLLRSLLTGTLSSAFVILLAVAVMAMTGFLTWGIFGAVAAGLVSGVLIGQFTEYYTSDEYKPTKGIAEQAKMGPATAIIDGLATGMFSTGYPVVVIVLGIVSSFAFAGGFANMSMGLYGIGFAAVGMLSTLGITLATDAYGPIADNAGGNAEMSGLPPEVRERTDALDALGNTTAATGKGFAIGSAALTALALIAAYIEQVKLWIIRFAGTEGGIFMGFTSEQALASDVMSFVEKLQLHLMNPLLLSGLMIGSMMAFVFCAMTMKAVGRAAGAMVNEVRRQFKEMPGIMDGTEKPDYARCVDISTVGAQREMLVPSLLAVVVPVITGIILGVPGVIGLLAGGLSTGFVLATMLNNAGGAWDNAKKYIEKGNLGGKKLPDGSKNPVHSAAVIGDTVGDPCKDTSGPSLNILIKLMSMVSIVFTPLAIKLAPIVQGWLHIAAK